MKRLVSLFVILCMLIGSVPALAEEADSTEELYLNVELKRYSGDSLSYNIIFDTNCPEVHQDIYYPDGTQRGKTTTYFGSVLETGGLYCSDGSYWDYDGEYLMVFRYGDLKVELIYTIENSDRYKTWFEHIYGFKPEEKEPESTESTNKGGSSVKVGVIGVSESEIELYTGDVKEITVASSKSVTVEIENEDIIEAELADGLLTITALKRGRSNVWLRTNDTYAAVDVKVVYDNAVGASEWAKADIRKGIKENFVPGEILEGWTRSITREEFAKMAVQFLKIEPCYLEKPFCDTTNPYVVAAYNAGIVQGIGDFKFNPTGRITRQEAAVMLMRTAQINSAEITGGVSDFEDNDAIAPWARDAVTWVKEIGIMKGDEKGCFNPDDEYTCEQAVVTFVRLGEYLD